MCTDRELDHTDPLPVVMISVLPGICVVPIQDRKKKTRSLRSIGYAGRTDQGSVCAERYGSYRSSIGISSAKMCEGMLDGGRKGRNKEIVKYEKDRHTYFYAVGIFLCGIQRM